MTDLQKKILEAIIKQPRPASVIARELGCSINVVCNTAHRVGVTLPSARFQPLSPERRAKISEGRRRLFDERRRKQQAANSGTGHPPCERAYVLHQFGFTDDELADRYGVSVATVQHWIAAESAKASA